ncbi:MAG TPA: hypothetical protein VKP65_08720 [Rhodothermales bacterium]|nr:hypothetical protein [Rhodothermales bacterium]
MATITAGQLHFGEDYLYFRPGVHVTAPPTTPISFSSYLEHDAHGFE